jgi:hypothetical protein
MGMYSMPILGVPKEFQVGFDLDIAFITRIFTKSTKIQRHFIIVEFYKLKP